MASEACGPTVKTGATLLETGSNIASPALITGGIFIVITAKLSELVATGMLER